MRLYKIKGCSYGVKLKNVDFLAVKEIVVEGEGPKTVGNLPALAKKNVKYALEIVLNSGKTTAVLSDDVGAFDNILADWEVVS